MRRVLPGFFTPPVILVLAAITFFVALTIFANSILFNTKKEPAPTSNQISPSPGITKSPSSLTNAVTSPRPTPTKKPIVNPKGWQTFINDKEGFSTEYPSNWTKLVCSDSGNISFGPDDQSVGGCFNDSSATILIFKSSNNFDSELATSEKWKNLYNDYQKQTLTIAGKNAVKIYAVSKAGSQASDGTIIIEYIIESPKSEALIVLYTQSPESKYYPADPDYTNVLNHVISTFKFLD